MIRNKLTGDRKAGVDPLTLCRWKDIHHCIVTFHIVTLQHTQVEACNFIFTPFFPPLPLLITT